MYTIRLYKILTTKVNYYAIVIYDVKLYMYFVNVIWLKI